MSGRGHQRSSTPRPGRSSGLLGCSSSSDRVNGIGWPSLGWSASFWGPGWSLVFFRREFQARFGRGPMQSSTCTSLSWSANMYERLAPLGTSADACRTPSRGQFLTDRQGDCHFERPRNRIQPAPAKKGSVNLQKKRLERITSFVFGEPPRRLSISFCDRNCRLSGLRERFQAQPTEALARFLSFAPSVGFGHGVPGGP